MNGDLVEFSTQKTVDETAAPGTLIREAATTKTRVIDIITWNKDSGSKATIIFYDEDSNIYLVVRLGADETAVISLNKPIIYPRRKIYARTSQASGADITITGDEC